ncbi:hypothetical protein LCGC14_2998400, partial [marine sediment metagenome]
TVFSDPVIRKSWYSLFDHLFSPIKVSILDMAGLEPANALSPGSQPTGYHVMSLLVYKGLSSKMGKFIYNNRISATFL